MGLVDPSEFDLELGISSAKVEDMAQLGRGENNVRVPEIIREIVGETALVETGKNVADAFGISQSSVSAYKIGAHSTSSYHQPNQELKDKQRNARERITTKARKRLLLALDSITPEKMNDVKARDAAGIAKDMSAVIRNIEPAQDNNGPQVQFVFYSPRPRSENDFEVIHVND